MNQEEFEGILKEKKYSYRIDGDKVIIDHHEHIELGGLTMLPENIIFKNNGYVSLIGLIDLPANIKFENNGEVYLKNGIYKRGHYTHN